MRNRHGSVVSTGDRVIAMVRLLRMILGHALSTARETDPGVAP